MKIIIYGYKLGSHTHSYIHWGFHRAFSAMGHEVLWVDENDDLSTVDLKDAVFFTTGLADKNIPLRADCKYICHNCGAYEGIGKRINIQYLTYDSYQYEQVAPGITTYDNCLFFAWGSPKFYWEFDENDLTRKKSSKVYFLGTVNGPKDGGNYDVVAKYAAECKRNGHHFIAGGGYTGRTKNQDITYLDGWISLDDHEKYLKEAYMAPALQGENQLGNGMIPCRLFKAISYGNDGITNNPLANNFFSRELVYNPDCNQLYYDAEDKNDLERRRWLFNEVRTKHTYMQRCQAIMNVL